MSYDLYFWRQKPEVTASPVELLGQIDDGDSPEGILPLSVAGVKEALRTAFPAIEIGDTQCLWEGAGSDFQVHFAFCDVQTASYVSVTCGYKLLDSPETMNAIINALNNLGCALYDPQTDERYEQPERRDS